jgi:hypothetical protein
MLTSNAVLMGHQSHIWLLAPVMYCDSCAELKRNSPRASLLYAQAGGKKREKTDGLVLYKNFLFIYELQNLYFVTKMA